MKELNDFSFWPALSRVFVGLFFIASALWKLFDGFFFRSSSPLAGDFQYWMDRGWTMGWYEPILRLLMPWSSVVAVLVIAAHGIGGAMLFSRKTTKWGAMILLFVQLQIWFSTFYGWGFLVMVGSSVWLCFYLVVSQELTHDRWKYLTWLLVVLYGLMLFGRFQRGDASLSLFHEQFAHFTREVMSADPSIKRVAVAMFLQPFGPWLWIFLWWWSFFLAVPFLLTRYRLIAGCIILLHFILRALLFLQVMGAEATIYVLLGFTWLAEEASRQARGEKGSFLPFPSRWL